MVKLFKKRSKHGGENDEMQGEGEKGAEHEIEHEDPEIAAARKEAEEKRAEKFRKMEEERETMRQGIRDKYGIKKRHVPVPGDEVAPTGIGRERKSQAELAAERKAEEEADDEGEFSSMFCCVGFV